MSSTNIMYVSHVLCSGLLHHGQSLQW